MAYEVLKTRKLEIIKSFLFSRNAYGVFTFLFFAVTLPVSFVFLQQRQTVRPEAASGVTPVSFPTVTSVQLPGFAAKIGSITNSSIEITWNIPDAEITSVTVAYTINARPPYWRMVKNLPAASQTYTIMNLLPSTEYLFTVQPCKGEMCMPFTSVQKSSTRSQ